MSPPRVGDGAGMSPPRLDHGAAMRAPRVAVFSGTTPLHVDMHRLEGRIVVVPMPLREGPDGMRRHLAEARVDRIVTDAANEALARSLGGTLPVTLAGDAAPAGLAELPPDTAAPRVSLRTGGTTGHGKVIDVPAPAMARHRDAAIARLACGPESVWLASLPLWHMGGVGLVDRCLHGGGRLLLPEGAGVPPGVTHVSLVPTMLHRLLAARPPASLQCALVGGDALDPGVVKAALAAGWPVHASYGLTEACGQVATAVPRELEAHPGTCGMPLDGVRVRIMTEDGEADPGQEGEIVVSGPTLAVPGPLHTGDLGRLDEAGRLFVTGRADDRITTGGEKVAPERVEAVLRGCSGVMDAGVIGVPDDEWGQRVVAFIVAQGTAAGAVRACAKASLAAHEVPREVHVIDALPRTPAGKLRRAVLRQMHARMA